MHRLLAVQVERCRDIGGAVDAAHLCELVDKTYVQFDTERARSDRASRLMLEELDEINRVRDAALASLKIEHQKLDAALSNMAHGLAMFNQDGTLAICNAQYKSVFGLSAIEPGAAYSEIAAQIAGTRAECDLNLVDITQAMSSREPIECTVGLADGRMVSSSFQPLLHGGWIEVHRDVTEQRKADEKIRFLANHDALTGLPNRHAFNEAIAIECERVKRGAQIALLCLDLDYFKSVNDTLGHPVGDKLLQFVAERLQRVTRSTDRIARLGGDEFAIVQVEASQPKGAMQLAQRIINVLTTPFEINDHQISVGTSVGIAVSPTDGTDADALMRNADMALYKAKADGRRAYRFFESGMDVAVQKRRTLELDLRRAILSNEFELHFQPLIDLCTNTVSACEALIRWNHPTRGRVPPDEFISLSEEIGLITVIGDWVLNQACTVASTWPRSIGVAVNISAVQFRASSLVDSVKRVLQQTGLEPGRLELEITETVLLQDTERTLQTLQELKSLGVRIAMDDFGTGYSSLSYLQRFPFDKLKIDRSFVENIGPDSTAGPIVKAVTQLATSMGMRTTAEGVETESQRAFLEALGCSEIQGYLISKPVSAAEIEIIVNDQLTALAAA